MLKKAARRTLSKTSLILTIAAAAIILLAILIFLMTIPRSRLNTPQPLGTPSETK